MSLKTLKGDSKIVYETLVKRKTKCEKKLIINIILQILIITLGVSYILKFNPLFKNLLIELKLEESVIKFLIPVALIYLFIELGFAMGQFFMIENQLKIVDESIINNFQASFSKINIKQLNASLKTLNIAGQLAESNTTPIGKLQTALAHIIFSIIIALNHCVVLGMIANMCGIDQDKKNIFLLSAFIVFTMFHVMYFKSSKSHDHSPSYTSKVSFFIIAISAIYLATLIIY